MTISKQEFSSLVKKFHLRELFNYFGWNNDHAEITVQIGNAVYKLNSVGDKSGFKALVCSPDSSGKIPEYYVRRQIHSKTSRYFKEHIIVFSNHEKTEQIWQYIYKKQNGLTKVCQIYYHISQDPEKLYQRAAGLFFTLDEEENITIIDVTQRVKENLAANSEKVTKRFYDGFRKEHKAFISFISGIDDSATTEWYASLMLNRLMFCYFIQKKGFLDNNRNYLQEKLAECRCKYGNDRFFSFYRNFLLTLFHKGFGSPIHSEELKSMIGNIPYLNGGLYDIHEIEKTYSDINISDEAFVRIFNFFDQWDWHLDTRPESTGQEINPDVLGYIFEKYINDRAQMGAYYTQEDITEYIARNCIIPFLFDEVKRMYANAFKPDGFIWDMFRKSKDKYVFDAVKKGIDMPLPEEIEIGMDTSTPGLLERRKEWNKPTPEEFALPTEIWRETVERRNRCIDLINKINNGQITEIQDFITYNLDIRAFLQDIINDIDDADFIRHFYKALIKITILDPTCGSGAFLFAALEILEPLYEACLMRMEQYVHEGRISGKKYKFFEEELLKLESGIHPNKQYYIYKSIILNNLYGVDIMNEAVETAKLRLFLKLISTADPDNASDNLGLEPLPDIDFNIKCGNSLIGFANSQQLKKVIYDKFDIIYETKEKDITERCAQLADTIKRFKELQLGWNEDINEYRISKMELLKRQEKLNNILDQRLFEEYEDGDFDNWKRTHQPFHWMSEFFDIIENNGGFSVVIGNPPYVNIRKVPYEISRKYNCFSCKDLFALIVELTTFVINKNGFYGLIIPLSATSTETMAPLAKHIYEYSSTIWTSYYSASDQPASLFNGVRHRILILLSEINESRIKNLYSTNFLKWFNSERVYLFANKVKYVKLNTRRPYYAKCASPIELQILNKLAKYKPLSYFLLDRSTYPVYYHNAPVHWGKVFNFIPYFKIGDNKPQQSTHIKEIYLDTKSNQNIVIGLLNSSLFYWYNWQFTNCRDLSVVNINKMPAGLNKMSDKNAYKLNNLVEALMIDFKMHSKIYRRVSNGITTEFDSFYPMLSKNIIDEIDYVLADHFNLCEEETDFIINYDFKYRMGISNLADDD